MSLLQLPLSARCLRLLLRFRLGCTLCPLCVVDGQASLGLNGSVLTVLRMLSEMSATWCSNAKHCKQHGRTLQACLGPPLLLCSNLCGKETLYRLHILCLNALRSLRPWVMTKDRACSACSSIPLIVYFV